jgi:ketosteroid isomerase-like protein
MPNHTDRYISSSRTGARLADILRRIPPTGKRMDAPCCDVFRLRDGKIQSFNCYPSGTVTMAQLGVLGNLQAAMSP